VKVLDEALQKQSNDVALEALRVLFGRIRYESKKPRVALAQLTSLRKSMSKRSPLTPELEEFFAFRIALLAWEAKRPSTCAIELKSSSEKLREALNEADSPSRRRDLSKHLFWLARCMAKTKDHEDQRIVPIFDEILSLGATGYYAMLMQQEFSHLVLQLEKQQPENPETTPSPAPALEQVTDPDALARTDRLQNVLNLVRASPKMMGLDRASYLWQELANWIAATLKGLEPDLFARRSDTLTSGWDALLATHRFSDVILGAGRVAQIIRLDRPEADTILAYLYPPAYPEAFAAASKNCDVDETTLYAVARQESLFNAQAVSPAGARGLLQVMPSVWRDGARHHLQADAVADPFNPQSNAIVGACHLRQALQNFDGDRILALAAYNAGAQHVKNWKLRRFRGDPLLFVEHIPFEETQNYVKQITRSLHHAPRIWGSSTAWAKLQNATSQWQQTARP
jgi:hypothetical protein